MKIWLFSDYDNRKHLAFRSLLHRFSTAFPEVHLEFSVKSRRSMWESMFAHLRDPKRNELADIIEIPQNWTELFTRLGMLADLATSVEPLARGRYPEFIMKELCRHDTARIFSAPWWMEAPAMFYRPQAVKGVCPDPAKDLASWEGFRAAIDRLPAGGGRGKRFTRALSTPGSSGAISVAEVLPRVWGLRGGLFSDDFTRATFTREETARGIEDWLELAMSGRIELFSPDRFENGPRPDDQCAFILSSRRVPGVGRGVEMLPYPGCAAGGGLLLVHSLAVSASAADRAGATAFVSWVLEPQNISSFAESFGVLPALKSELEERLQRDKASAVYRRLFSGPELMPNIMAYPTAELLLERALWNLSLKVARHDYDREDLNRELIMAQGEADYLLSLY